MKQSNRGLKVFLIKKKFRFYCVSGFLLALFLLSPVEAQAEWIQDDQGIQKVHQDNVPQITSAGRIQYSYTPESFFPLALYHVDPQTLAEVKDAGFNTIFSWGFPRPGFNYNNPYPPPGNDGLNLLNQYGLKIFLDLEGIAKNTPPASRLTAIANHVNAFKNDPAVLAWHLFDERFDITGGDYYSVWEGIRNTIRTNDPQHAIIISTVPTTYEKLVDILDGISYEISGTLARTAGSVSYLMKLPFNPGGSGLKKPVFVILKAFGSTDFGPIPTPEQIRGQMYTAIAHGATGLWLFVQDNPYVRTVVNGISPRVNAAQWEAAKIANREIEQYKKVFLSKTATDEYRLFYQRSCRPTAYFCKGCGDPCSCGDYNGTGVYNCEVHGCTYNTETGVCSGGPCCGFKCSSATDQPTCSQHSCTWTNDCQEYLTPHPLRALLKDTGEPDIRYLLAVNVDFAPLEGRFSFDNYPKPIVQVTSLFDQRNITVTNGTFTDSFEGYGVRLYKLNTAVPTPTSTPTPTPLPGDLNHNGKVDIFDYNLLVQNFGKTDCGNVADIDTNCKVDIFDYNILVGNFGLP